MNSNIEKAISLINSFIQAYSSFDIQALEQLVDDKFEFKNISQGEVLEEASNKIEFSLILEQSKILFSDRTIEIQSLNLNKQTAQADVLINATMAISTPDGLRAGQVISYNAKLNFYIENLKIQKVSFIS